MTIKKIPNSNLYLDAYISEDWLGGYKLEVDLSSKTNAQDWTLDFDLPNSNYSIRGAYGVDLIDNGNNNYTISGQDGWQDLEPGETAKAVFIIDDNQKKAFVPQFTNSDSSIATQAETATATTDNILMGAVVSQPEPNTTPAKAPQPAQLSSDAITVGFEGHSANTKYTNRVQNQDWDVAWSHQMDKYATISNQEARSGNNSLQMSYPANAQSNAGAKWLVPNQQEYYLSYWVKFDNNFDFDGNKYSGGKLPGMGSGDLASGGKKPTGTNGFTSRYMWREDGKATLYLYHMNQPGTYGEDILLKDSDGSDKYFERGQWHNLVQRVKVNDGSQSNGEIDVWMDNEQVLSMDNLKFMTNNQGIDTMYFSTFHGGYDSDWWPEQEVKAHFDDFVVSTNAADVGL
ncbi:hypothetical protein IQ255_01885 [Pleurocapsales cyanobacterium LEGE 10410]|nr:hypothetical protein [Pleurocapsales cyanobacterium LEGE 10410]